VKFIFATTEYHKLPDTILSRCQQYDFRMIPTRELHAHLRDVATKESIKISDAALDKIARAAEGSARDALSLFDQVLSFSGQEVRDEDLQALLGLVDRELLIGASRAVAASDGKAVFELIERLADYGADTRNFLRELLLHFRELMLLKLAPGSKTLLAGVVPEERARLEEVAALYSEEDLLRAFETLAKAEIDIRAAADPRVTLEFALLKLAQLRKLLPFAELAARVERLAGGGSERPSVAPPPTPRPVAVAAPRPSPPAPPPLEMPARKPAPPEPAPVAVAAAVAPPPAPTAPVPSDDSDLLARLRELTDKRPSLREPLRGAELRLDGDTAILTVVADYVAFAEAHADDYRGLAETAVGRKLKLQIGGSAGAPAASGPVETKKDRLMQEASREPAVQDMLDLFGGKVVDVREG